MNRRERLYVFTLLTVAVVAVSLTVLVSNVIKAREKARTDDRIQQGLDLIHEIVHKK